MTTESVQAPTPIRNDAAASPSSPADSLGIARAHLFIASALSDALACSRPSDMQQGNLEIVAELTGQRINLACQAITVAHAATDSAGERGAIDTALTNGARARAVAHSLANERERWLIPDERHLVAGVLREMIDRAAGLCDVEHLDRSRAAVAVGGAA